MENASKALLIAGAILLVIAIIAIAVGIVSSTRGTIDLAENQIDTMAVQMHNKQFEVYDGKVKGTEVKECIAKVLSNNSNSNNVNMNVMVLVQLVDDTYRYGKVLRDNGSIESYKESCEEDINPNAIFDAVIYTNSKGIIYAIEFIDPDSYPAEPS